MHVHYIEWYNIYCHEDGKTHMLHTKNLEPEDSDVLNPSDLKKGCTLLWKVKGKKYTTTFLEVSGKKHI